MAPYTSEYYACHYAPIQQAKYAQLWPLIKDYFSLSKKTTLLDLGIGPAWLESFLSEKKVSFSRIVGVDISEEAIAPRKKNIEYIISPNFATDEKFDVVICFDAWHCFPLMDLKKFLKRNGLLIVSEPRPFAHLLDAFAKNALLDEWVGDGEKSHVVVMRSKNFP